MKLDHNIKALLVEIKTLTRSNGSTWSGLYPCYAITPDQQPLCFKCIRENYRLVLRETIDWKGQRGQWAVTAIAVNYENSELTCDNCNKLIGAAYV